MKHLKSENVITALYTKVEMYALDRSNCLDNLIRQLN